ncbi:MAG TPA: hypothetical protein VKU44_08820 [Terriglobia bacterium]|nr:hypothetical protein [Terriglobia bacterium]
MQWVLKLATEKDPINICRLMNIFRRKGVSILKLHLEAAGSAFVVTALVDTRESDVPHLFNFLRRTEGVQEVTCYREAGSADEAATRRAPGARPDLAAGRGGNGLVHGAGSVEFDSSLVIHSSRAFGEACTGARSSAAAETLSVG